MKLLSTQSQIFKGLILFLILCLSTQSLVLASPVPAIVASEISPISTIPSASFKQELSLYANVAESFQIDLADSSKTLSKKGVVILFQEAHGMETIQRNIALSLDQLQRHLQVDNPVIALEGSEDKKIDHALLSKFPDSEIRKDLANHFFKEKIIDGSLLYATQKNSSAQIYGIDDATLVASNRASYQHFLASQDQALAFAEQARQLIDTIKRTLYSPQAFYFENRETLFKQGKESLSQYLPWLIKEYEQIMNYPLLEGTFYPNLKEYYSQSVNPDKKERPLNISSAELWQEITQMQNAISDRLLISSEEKHLRRLGLNRSLLENLFRFELSPQQYHEWQAEGRSYFESHFEGILKEYKFLAKKQGILFRSQDFSAMMTLASEAESFYDQALERDQALFTNLQDLHTLFPAQPIFAITGGFHSPGLTRLLKDAQIPYLLLSPHSNTEESNHLYWQALAREDSSPWQTLFSHIKENQALNLPDIRQRVFMTLALLAKERGLPTDPSDLIWEPYLSALSPADLATFSSLLLEVDSDQSSNHLPITLKKQPDPNQPSLDRFSIGLDSYYLSLQNQPTLQQASSLGNESQPVLQILELSDSEIAASSEFQTVRKKANLINAEKLTHSYFSRIFRIFVENAASEAQVTLDPHLLEMAYTHLADKFELPANAPDSTISTPLPNHFIISFGSSERLIEITRPVEPAKKGETLKSSVQIHFNAHAFNQLDIWAKHALIAVTHLMSLISPEIDMQRVANETLLLMAYLAQESLAHPEHQSGSLVAKLSQSDALLGSEGSSQVVDSISLGNSLLDGLRLISRHKADDLFVKALTVSHQQDFFPGKVLLSSSKEKRFILKNFLSRGGMGELWTALDQHNQKTVVIKRIAAKFRNTAERTAAIDRFKMEIESLRRNVSVPDSQRHLIAQFVDSVAATTDGYLVMSFIPGDTLHDFIASKVYNLKSALQVVISLLSALETLHKYPKSIHRDLKPANIIIREGTREVAIVDFGLSIPGPENAGMTVSVQHITQPSFADFTRFISDERLTAFGNILGTPHYMSPEQVMGRSQDEILSYQTDIFPVATILYQLLAGELPFAPNEKNVLKIMGSIYNDRPAPLSERLENQIMLSWDQVLQFDGGKPSDAKLHESPEYQKLVRFLEKLDPILAKAHAKDMESRYSNVRDFREALEALLPAVPDTGYIHEAVTKRQKKARQRERPQDPREAKKTSTKKTTTPKYPDIIATIESLLPSWMPIWLAGVFLTGILSASGWFIFFSGGPAHIDPAPPINVGGDPDVPPTTPVNEPIIPPTVPVETLIPSASTEEKVQAFLKDILFYEKRSLVSDPDQRSTLLSQIVSPDGLSLIHPGKAGIVAEVPLQSLLASSSNVSTNNPGSVIEFEFNLLRPGGLSSAEYKIKPISFGLHYRDEKANPKPIDETLVWMIGAGENYRISHREYLSNVFYDADQLFQDVGSKIDNEIDPALNTKDLHLKINLSLNRQDEWVLKVNGVEADRMPTKRPPTVKEIKDGHVSFFISLDKKGSRFEPLSFAIDPSAQSLGLATEAPDSSSTGVRLFDYHPGLIETFAEARLLGSQHLNVIVFQDANALKDVQSRHGKTLNLLPIVLIYADNRVSEMSPQQINLLINHRDDVQVGLAQMGGQGEIRIIRMRPSDFSGSTTSQSAVDAVTLKQQILDFEYDHQIFERDYIYRESQMLLSRKLLEGQSQAWGLAMNSKTGFLRASEQFLVRFNELYQQHLAIQQAA